MSTAARVSVAPPPPKGNLPCVSVSKRALGGRGSFEDIYRLYSGRVYWLCLRMMRNPAEAEDLTQEVFLHAFQKMHQFQGRADFSTWLRRVAVNVVLMQLRKKSHPTASLEEILSSEKSDERSRSSLATIDTSLAGAIDRVLLAQAIEVATSKAASDKAKRRRNSWMPKSLRCC